MDLRTEDLLKICFHVVPVVGFDRWRNELIWEQQSVYDDKFVGEKQSVRFFDVAQEELLVLDTVLIHRVLFSNPGYFEFAY
jgi:hypothetical protein